MVAEKMHGDLERWGKAVIHIECFTSGENIEDVVERERRLQELIDRCRAEGRHMTMNEYHEAISKAEGLRRSREISQAIEAEGREPTPEEIERIVRAVFPPDEEAFPRKWKERHRGTAIFLTHEDKRFLVTARHVIYDERGAELDRALGKTVQRNYVCEKIIRVPNFGEPARRSYPELVGIWAKSQLSYAETDDLAVISLDETSFARKFANDLVDSGFRPVSVADISDGPSHVGSEVFVVGYPDATSIIHERQEESPFSSSATSLPTASFGRIALRHERLPYFWSDLSAYPGISGAPIVEDGIMIGVVTEQPFTPVTVAAAEEKAKILAEVLNLHTRIPFCKGAIGSRVKNLIERRVAECSAYNQWADRFRPNSSGETGVTSSSGDPA